MFVVCLYHFNRLRLNLIKYLTLLSYIIFCTLLAVVLSSFLFSRYIRDMLCELAEADANCIIGGVFVNILVCADDLDRHGCFFNI